MAVGHLSHDEFFSRLGELFASRKGKDHGAVYLTQKRLGHGQDTGMATDEDDFADLHNDTPLPILVRATNGKSQKNRSDKVKLATVVQSDALEAFYARYADVCRTGMVSLKPRDRSKRKAKARKKKGGPAAA